MTAFMNFICATEAHGRAYWTIAACILVGGFIERITQ